MNQQTFSEKSKNAKVGRVVALDWYYKHLEFKQIEDFLDYMRNKMWQQEMNIMVVNA